MTPTEAADVLAACPFCGASETRVDEHTHWTGRQSVVMAVTVRHWCARIDGLPQSHMELRGRTRSEAIAAWNRRALRQSAGSGAVDTYLAATMRHLAMPDGDEADAYADAMEALWHGMNNVEREATDAIIKAAHKAWQPTLTTPETEDGQ